MQIAAKPVSLSLILVSEPIFQNCVIKPRKGIFDRGKCEASLHAKYLNKKYNLYAGEIPPFNALASFQHP
jgi:hypothetical protein